MDRYRFKLESGRVIGPFTINEINELISKNKISNNDQVQEFPIGEWIIIKNFPTINILFKENITLINEETFLINLKDLKNKSELAKEEVESADVVDSNINSKPEEHNEFKYENEDPSSDGAGVFTQPELKTSKETQKIEERSFVLESTEPKGDGKTVQKNISEFKSEAIDKTQINPDYQSYLNKIKKEQKKIDAELKAKEEEIVIEEVKPDYENESTQMISYSDMKEDLLDAIEVEEKFESDSKRILNKKVKVKPNKDNDFEEEVEDNTLKKKLVVGTIVVLLVFISMFENDEKPKRSLKEIKTRSPEISFPLRFDVEDSVKSEILYKKGLLEMRKFTYLSSVKASKYFLKSTENKFDENPAMAKLIFIFSHNLINSPQKNEDANKIFKLVQIFRTKAFSDMHFASAIAYFYYSIGKLNASLKTFDKYITLNKKKASLELFSVRLLALTKAGILDKAEKTAEKLMLQKNKDLFTLQALYEFYRVQNQQDKMLSLLEEAQSIYPNNAFVLIEKATLFAEQGDYKELLRIIYKLNSINVEGSRYYYSKYLILKGMLHAHKKQIREASIEFKKSLKLNESIDLIEKLSLLGESEDNEANELITRSKAKKAIIKGRVKASRGEIKEAFKYALKASSIAPDMIEVRLFLADLQMKRGYINDAIVQLEKLYKENPLSIDILFSLIDAYTEAFKFRKVVSLLGAAQNIAGAQSDRFYSAKAKYSIYRGDFNSGSGWLQRAINANPLNDKNIYELAKLYIKYHEYHKGKSILKRAMDLDPTNVDFRISFAKIIYELETSKAAIGYLYNVLSDFPDNPKIYSAIGTYFYRSGQLKKYEGVREKLLALPRKDVSLYEFLIESARLDDDIEKVILYSEDLIELNPGDLNVRMDLASIYINLQRYKKAKKQLDGVSERLDTYPKLQYLNAKLYFLIDDLEHAKPLVEKEIRENPTVIDGYLLLGDIHVKEKNLSLARKEFMKAVQLKPNNIDAILGIAYVAFHSDQYDMALDQYKKAIEIDSNRSDVYKLLGDAYRKLGQSQFAIKNYKHFLELSPNSKYKNSIETYINTMQ